MIDFSKEHKTLLSRLAKSPNDMEARADLLRCNCLWAEENIKGNKTHGKMRISYVKYYNMGLFYSKREK